MDFSLVDRIGVDGIGGIGGKLNWIGLADGLGCKKGR